MSKARRIKPNTTARGYGWNHQQRRAAATRLVAAGRATCARCGHPILPGDPWDLGHDDDDRSRYSGPEHQACNRATNGRRQHVKLAELAQYADNPEREIFWGPPGADGVPQRWSRQWFDWRADVGIAP